MKDKFPEKPFASTKELIGSFLFAAGVWFASFTFLLPFFFLLVVSSWLRNKFFVVLFSFIVGGKSSSEPNEMRVRLFDRIRQECSSGKGSNKNLRILEIGVGPGSNFRYYTADDTVTLLDMNPNFKDKIKSELKKYPDLNVDRLVIAKAEDMKEILNEEYDVVVCTLLICSVSDRMKVMKEARRVLKTGGKLAFLEHVGYPKEYLAYWIQRMISPLWYIYCNGCRVDRSWRNELNKVFSDVTYDVIYPTFMPMFLRPHAIGLATK